MQTWPTSDPTRLKTRINSGEATGGVGGLNPPTLLQGHSRDLYRTNEKYFGYYEVPPPKKKLRTTFAGSDVSLSGGDDAHASLRSRKVPRRL